MKNNICINIINTEFYKPWNNTFTNDMGVHIFQERDQLLVKVARGWNCYIKARDPAGNTDGRPFPGQEYSFDNC